MFRVMTGACGVGKSKRALKMMLDMQGTAIYVAPTRALAHQFAQWLRNHGEEALEAFGRNRENCSNPLADIAIASGHSHTVVCAECKDRKFCSYWIARSAIENLPLYGKYAVTTYHFLTLANVTPQADSIIYDDVICPIISVDSKMKWVVQDARVAVKTKQGKRHVYHCLPHIPQGKQETLLLSATPVASLWAAEDTQYEQIDDGYALDQVVYYHLHHLTHSSNWFPPPGSCGFKKNTPPGQPYFLASTGLEQWRGTHVSAAGTFQPPIQYLGVLAKMLSRLYNDSHSVQLIPAVLEFDNGKKVPTAFWAVCNGTVVVDVSCMPSVFPLIQLLGRGGKDTTSTYYGDLPLNFSLLHPSSPITVRTTRRVVLLSAPRDILAFHRMRHDAALAIQGLKPEKRLSAESRKYLAFARNILKSLQETEDGEHDK